MHLRGGKRTTSPDKNLSGSIKKAVASQLPLPASSTKNIFDEHSITCGSVSSGRTRAAVFLWVCLIVLTAVLFYSGMLDFGTSFDAVTQDRARSVAGTPLPTEDSAGKTPAAASSLEGPPPLVTPTRASSRKSGTNMANAPSKEPEDLVPQIPRRKESEEPTDSEEARPTKDAAEDEAEPTKKAAAATEDEAEPTKKAAAATDGEAEPTKKAAAATDGEAEPTKKAAASTDGEAEPTKKAAAATEDEAEPTKKAAAATDGEAEPTKKAAAATDDEAEPTKKAAAATEDEAEPTKKAAAATDDEAEPTKKAAAATEDEAEPTKKAAAATEDEAEPTKKAAAATDDEAEPTTKAAAEDEAEPTKKAAGSFADSENVKAASRLERMNEKYKKRRALLDGRSAYDGRRYASQKWTSVLRGRDAPQRVSLGTYLDLLVIPENPNPNWQCLCSRSAEVTALLGPAGEYSLGGAPTAVSVPLILPVRSGNASANVSVVASVNGTTSSGDHTAKPSLYIADVLENATLATVATVAPGLVLRIQPCRFSAAVRQTFFSVCKHAASSDSHNTASAAAGEAASRDSHPTTTTKEKAYDPTFIPPCRAVDAAIRQNASRHLHHSGDDMERPYAVRRKHLRKLLDAPNMILRQLCACNASRNEERLMVNVSSDAFALLLASNTSASSPLTNLTLSESNSLREFLATSYRKKMQFLLQGAERDRPNAAKTSELVADLQTGRKDLQTFIQERCDSNAHGLDVARCTATDVAGKYLPLIGDVAVHSLSSTALLACYARGDMVCKVVGLTGGWEMELQHVVMHAARTLRSQVRLAASLLVRQMAHDTAASRTSPASSSSEAQHATASDAQPSVGQAKKKKRSATVQSTAPTTGYLPEFALNAGPDNPELFRYSLSDVQFVDIGGNVGVFSYNMWKSGYTVRTVEALPSNVRLLRLSRCINFREEHNTWRTDRRNRLARLRISVEDATRKMLQATSNATVLEIQKHLERTANATDANATARLPRAFQLDAAGQRAVRLVPDISIYHTALGARRHTPRHDDGDSSSNVAAAAGSAVAGASCVMLSEESNYGDVVLICDNQTLLDDARQMLAAAAARDGDTSGRLLGTYLPRGIVQQQRMDALVLGGHNPLCQHTADRYTGALAEDNCVVARSATTRGKKEKNAPSSDDADAAAAPAGRAAEATVGWDFTNTWMHTRFDMARLLERNASLKAEVEAYRRGLQTLPDAATRARYAALANRTKRERQAVYAQPYISSSSSQAALLSFVATQHTVVKIDIEGHEQMALDGAYDWLRHPILRPKLILSEVWRKRNLTEYFRFMLEEMGYVGFGLTDQVWIRTAAQGAYFHSHLPREMDTVVWIVPGFEYLLPSSSRDFSVEEPALLKAKKEKTILDRLQSIADGD